MFKRLLQVFALLSVAIAVLAGCRTTANDIDEAFEAYSQLHNLMSVGVGNEGAFDIDFALLQDMGGMSMSVNNGNIKAASDGHNVEIYMTMTTEAVGSPPDSAQFYVILEGARIVEALMIIDGMGMDMRDVGFSIAEILAIVNPVNAPQVGKEAILSAEVTDNENGRVISLVIKGEALEEYGIEKAGGRGMLEALQAQIAVEDTTIAMYFDEDGNAQGMSMDMTILLTQRGETIQIRTFSDFTFIAFNDDVVVR
jgi:hypothetical protein